MSVSTKSQEKPELGSLWYNNISFVIIYCTKMKISH